MGEGLDKAREAYETGGKKVVGTDGRSLEGCAQQLLGLGVTPKIGKSAAGRKKKSQGGIAGQGQFLDVSAEQVSEDSEGDDQDDGDQEAAANQ